MGEHDQDIDNLNTIPGIGRRAAENIIAETGGDMAPFATAANLASWIGVCPGMNESAVVAKSGHTRDGNGNLKRVLGVAAMAAIKQKDSYYGVYYRRLAAGRRDIDLPYQYLGADDHAGPNYTGQPAVHSVYAER
jgi:transposase